MGGRRSRIRLSAWRYCAWNGVPQAPPRDPWKWAGTWLVARQRTAARRGGLGRVEAAEQRLGGAQRGRKTRGNGRGGSRGSNLLLDVGGKAAQGSRVPVGTIPQLVEGVLGTVQVLLESADAVGHRRRGGSRLGGKLHSSPHAVGNAAVSPPGRLRSRGRSEGDHGWGRAWARLGDQEGPDQQAGQGPGRRAGLVGGAGLSGVGACAEGTSTDLHVAVGRNLLEEVVRTSRLQRRCPGAKMMFGGGGTGPLRNTS